MEDAIDRLHGKALLDLNDEKVDAFLVALQKIYRVVALTDQNLILFAREELRELIIGDGSAAIFERRVEQGQVLREF